MAVVTGGENFFLGMQNTPRYTLATSDDSLLMVAVDSEDGVADELRTFPIASATGALSAPSITRVAPSINSSIFSRCCTFSSRILALRICG